jgi:hypothetical protein
MAGRAAIGRRREDYFVFAGSSDAAVIAITAA